MISLHILYDQPNSSQHRSGAFQAGVPSGPTPFVGAFFLRTAARCSVCGLPPCGAANPGQCHILFPVRHSLHSLWGGPPRSWGPRWGRRPRRLAAVWMMLISLAKSGSRGTRADQGGPPHNFGRIRSFGKKYAALANPGCGVPSGPLSAGGCRMRRLAHGPKEPPERRPQRGPQDKIARPTTNPECRDGQSEWQPPRNRPGRPPSCNFGFRLPSDRPHPFTPLAPTSLAGLRFRLRSPDFPDWAVDCSGSTVRRAVTPVKGAGWHAARPWATAAAPPRLIPRSFIGPGPEIMREV